MDKHKEIIQKKAFNSWLNAGCRGTIEMATGVGKTFVAIHCISYLPKGSNVLFLYEETSRKQNIIKEINQFEKFYDKKIFNNYNLSYTTYQSAYKLKNTCWDLVIADECHDSFSPVYSQFYFNNEYKYIVGLSATIDQDVLYDNGLTKGDYLNKIAPICFTYTLKEAQKDGASPELNIYIYHHQLDHYNKNIKAGNSKKPFLQTEKDNYEYWSNKFKKSLYLKESDAKDYVTSHALRKMTSLLYNLPSKVNLVKEILPILKGKTLIYANSLEFLGKITDNVVSSHKQDEDNTHLLYKFEIGKINTLGSFKKLEQGINLSHLENIVICSYYGKEKSLIQRIGRIRKEGNKIGNVIIILTERTQEEKWLHKMMGDNFKLKHVYSIEHLKEKILNL